MIIVQFIGGVGNQMFQYAAARAASLRSDLNFKIDLNGYDDYNLRKYELDNFNIQENIARPLEIINLLKSNRIFRKVYLKEKKMKFSKKFLKMKKRAYLEGYFQSEKYFKDFEDVIRRDFTFKNLDFIQNKDLLEEIQTTNSVSVHVRCGDYMTNPETAKIYNLCDKNYYERGMKYIAERVENPTFFVFSDDIEWCKNNFVLDLPVKYVKTANWQEDFYFVQNCKHNIIANSSFAWWSAWLNKNPEKIVVAPEKWFQNCKLNYDSIVPRNWIKVKVGE